MIEKKKQFWGGLVMMLGFIVVLIIIFMPIFNGQNGLIHGGDAAVNSAAGDDAITLFQIADHLAVLFGLFLLGPKQKEIKNGKHQDERNETGKTTGATRCFTPLAHGVR